MSRRIIRHKNRLPKIAGPLGLIPKWELPSIAYALAQNTIYGETFANQNWSNLRNNGTGIAIPVGPIVYTIGQNVYAIAPDGTIAANQYQVKIYKSTNKGQTFSILGDLKTGFIGTDKIVRSFCTDNQGNYVMASNNNTWHSTDGENWTISGTFSNTIKKVIYCQSAPTINGFTDYFYVMTTSNSEHANSSNGITYSTHTTTGPNHNADMVWCKDLNAFMRCHEQINQYSAKMSFSTDGFTYSTCGGSGVSLVQWGTMCYSETNKMMVAVGVASGNAYVDARIAISTDGQNITEYPAPPALSGTWRSVVATIDWLEKSGVFILTHTDTAYLSTDGINWTEVLNTGGLGIPSSAWFGSSRQHSIIAEI